MRRSVAISLLLLYIIASSGVAIRVHYSAGKLKSINVLLDSSSDKVCAKKVSSDKPATNAIGSHKGPSAVISNNSIKEVLKCVSIVSQGFFQAYDDADTMPGAPSTAVRDISMVTRVS